MTADTAQRPNERRRRLPGFVTFLVAVATSIAGAFLAAFVGDYVTRLYHVSDMEGGRGMMVIFLCVPLGLLAGFITGLIVGLCTAATGFGGFLKVQGLSLASLIGLGAIVTGLFWIGADKPPVIGGKTLTLDFELRVPPGVAFPAEPAYSNVHASLYANDRDNRVAEIDFHSIRREGDNVIAPGTAPLMSHSSNRSLLAQIEGESGSSQFIPVKLPPSPRKADEAWSDWIVADEQADLSPIPEPQRMAVRYRVRPISE